MHADPPVEHKAYLHRSGRTARAGAEGTVVTLMMDAQVSDVRDLTRRAGIKPTVSRTQPGDALLSQIAPGERTYVAAKDLPAAEPERQGGGSGRGRSGGGRPKQGGQGGTGAGNGGRNRRRGGAGQASSSGGAGASTGRAPRAGGSGRSRATAAGGSGGSHSAASFSSARRSR